MYDGTCIYASCVTDQNMDSRIKHTHTHTCMHIGIAHKQTYTDIPTHITRIHTQTTFIHTCEKHTETNAHLMALLPTDSISLLLSTKSHTHTFTFDFVSLVEADLTVPLGRVRAGGHKHTARHGTVETPPLPACCALTTDGARPVQRHAYQTTGLTFIYAHLLLALLIQASVFVGREY